MKIKGKHVELKTNIIRGRCPECKNILTVRVECGGMGTTRISCTKCTYTRITEKPISEWLEE